MVAEPHVQPLPYQHRNWFFRILFIVFVITVPAFIFYAAGYRLDLFTNPGSIMTVGGMFISTDAEDTQIHINEERVENYRLFQRAAYIQNLPAGIHRVHVQGEGLHTWVKELPVYPHIVTEANAFNMPEVPQVRLITPYQTEGGIAVLRGASSTVPASTSVTYRNTWVATTSLATTTLTADTEYAYLEDRFASSTETRSLLERVTAEIERFTFADPSATTTPMATTTATTTKLARDRVLYERDGELYVTWLGSQSNIPHYFCIPNAETTTTVLYSTEVIAELAAVQAAENVPLSLGSRTCRDTIKIGADGEELFYFDFLPSDHDLVVLHRSDGIVVKEVDDRNWQNTQLLYPAGEYDFLVDGSRLFIKTPTYILELFTAVE